MRPKLYVSHLCGHLSTTERTKCVAVTGADQQHLSSFYYNSTDRTLHLTVGP